ncbi:MAG TPA: hypothetical protein VIO61_00320 [Anaerolineaceae bacterium]
MRITRDILLKIARDTAAQRVRVNRRIICIYLVGSLLGDDPLLGGTTDIDLVFIHDSEPPFEREITPLSEDIHLDISHYSQAVFRQPRRLRVDPWLSPFIVIKPIVLHDTQHWFEFTQASITAQFYEPSYVLQRARSLEDAARQTWMTLHTGQHSSHPGRVAAFFKALEKAGNAIASLTGTPLAERRFLVQFPLRVQALQRPDLSAGVVGVFASQAVTGEVWQSWETQWAQAYQEASLLENRPLRLHPARQGYYQRAATALWGEHPAAAIWLLMRTWTLSLCQPGVSAERMEEWQAACRLLGLQDDAFHARLDALDGYLDLVEEYLDAWGARNGV